MKLTIKGKEKEGMDDWKKLDPGTVVKLKNGAQCVVYFSPQKMEKCLLILGYSSTLNFNQAFGFLDHPVVEIVGKVSEIIVEDI